MRYLQPERFRLHVHYLEAIRRSDDITIDSTTSVKQRGKGRFTRKPAESQVFSSKTVPRKHCIVSPIVSEEGDEESKTKKEHVETFAKELLVMTSDEASFKNRRLPKESLHSVNTNKHHKGTN
ncbi:hypothetical protein YC2023_041987 [Brassica napus]